MGIRYGKKGHDIEERAKKAATDDPDFQKLFDDYCESITDLSRASLAEYVIHRKAVIDLFERALETGTNGKYSLESRIHSIICPMRTTSDDTELDDLNLWLIDDRLAYHHYLASDKKSNPFRYWKITQKAYGLGSFRCCPVLYG